MSFLTVFWIYVKKTTANVWITAFAELIKEQQMSKRWYRSKCIKIQPIQRYKVQSYKNTKLQPIQRFENGIIQKIQRENIRNVYSISV